MCFLIALAKQGDRNAYDRLVRRYHGFVRLKASSYFLAGGDADDLIQEGLVGLYKAIRDFRTDRESSFRNFADSASRQIITAVKTATRNKHTPLNQYVSFSSTPAGSGDDVPTLDQMLRVRPSTTRSTRSSPARSCVRSWVASRRRSPSSRAGSSRCTSTATPTSRSVSASAVTPRRRQRAAARKAQGRRPPRLARRGGLNRLERRPAAGLRAPCERV